MKKVFQLLTFMTISVLIYSQNSATISLNSGWQFSEAGKNEWKDAVVPGSVQSDLIRLGVLPDPYYGTNENVVQWPEEKDWDYKQTFTVTPEQLKSDEALLVFEGLDTHADVFLNGSRILQTQNMFVGHKISVKNSLQAGENKLYIRFYSPLKLMEPARLTAGYEYPAGNDHSDKKVSIFNRKAPYQFGWDWGIRIVQMGIWKPVSLQFYNQACIDNLYVKQLSVSKDQALTDNQIEILSTSEIPVKIVTGAVLNGREIQTAEKQTILKKGKNKVCIALTIDNPELWMPSGWGKQNRYDFYAKVYSGERLIAEKTEKTGLRKVQLVQQPDEHGKSFYFEVNDIPLFAKGTNYIPGEILRTQQDKTYYDRLFDNLTEANMNFIRVWGGGTYEDDYFYQLADEKGILVWQDFIFGCVPYPSDDAFLANVKEEVIYNVKRLRNHPSLAFWCGNNEIDEGLDHWGWDKEYSAEINKEWREGYNKTFRKLIPELVNENDGTRSYIHGSPYDSNWGNLASFSSSDVHDWGLWHGRMPFEAMTDRLPRFASEFGFQSFPEMKTIRTFATEKDFDINSDVMKIHQKSGIGNTVIKQYMDMYYHAPKNFEDFVYVGLVMQGNGMKEAVEANRRGRPYCMGALYWQLNDDWPVVSWSSVDYYNNWKAQHYKMRDVFAPVALGSVIKDNKLSYLTMSDKLEDVNNLVLNIQVIDFSGKKLKSFSEAVTAKANTSRIVKTFDTDLLLTEDQKHNCVIHAWLSDKNGKIVSVKDYYFFWPNKLNLPQTTISKTVKYEDGKYTITLSSPKLAKDVFVEIPVQGARFSDNFFDLMPGQKKVITIISPELKKIKKTDITIRHLRETY
ncbi:MAG TPA: glycoside hydrolase family 2 protein [Paludibacteraceae bacterium]|nr:glycoside hydrolase family 2 protein [Paludibacteraceae bacterium]